MRQWTTDGGAPADRTSAETAREIIERLLPEASFRRFALDVLVELIDFASEIDPASWTISLFRNRLRLNVALSWTMTIGDRGIDVPADPEELAPEVIRRLEGQTGNYEESDRKFDWVQLEPGHEDLWPALRPFVLRRLKRKTDPSVPT